MAKDCSACFHPYPVKRRISEHTEDRSARLLYRNRRTYAIGHGCSPSWIENESRASEIKTEIIPVFEMKPIVPASFSDLQLKMYDLSDFGNPEEQISVLLRFMREVRILDQFSGDNCKKRSFRRFL